MRMGNNDPNVLLRFVAARLGRLARARGIPAWLSERFSDRCLSLHELDGHDLLAVVDTGR